jgi:hypothetical protein
MAYFSVQVFTEASNAATHFTTVVQNGISQLYREIFHGVHATLAHGVQATLDDVGYSVEMTIQLIVEQTRDVVEDGTAYIRPEVVS